MGKKHRLKKLRLEALAAENPLMWAGEEGIYTIGLGEMPSPEKLAEMTAAYQARIRNSPLWNEMVAQFGEQQAAEMLKEFKVKAEKGAERKHKLSHCVVPPAVSGRGEWKCGCADGC